MVEYKRIGIPKGLLDWPTASLAVPLDEWESRFGPPHMAEEDMDAGVLAPAVAWCVRIGELEVFVEHYLELQNTTLYVRGGSIQRFLELADLAGTPVQMVERLTGA